jgi:hypothetical protein
MKNDMTRRPSTSQFVRDFLNLNLLLKNFAYISDEFIIEWQLKRKFIISKQWKSIIKKIRKMRIKKKVLPKLRKKNIKYNIRLKTRSLKNFRSRTSKLEVTKKTLQKQRQNSKP